MLLNRFCFAAVLATCLQQLAAQAPVNYSQGEITNLSQAKFVKVVEEVNFNGLGSVEKIPYSKIKGSRFWRDGFEEADLYSNTGTVYTASVRIDLSSGAIHFLKNGEELVLTGVGITKLIFRRDSTIFLANVPNLLLHNKPVEEPVQVLTPGKYQLLRYVKRTVSSADSLFRTQKRYFFKDEVYYFLQHGETITRLKKLNKENIMELLPSSAGYSTWISANGMDLKKEPDAVRFINHYNTTHSFKEN